MQQLVKQGALAGVGLSDDGYGNSVTYGIACAERVSKASYNLIYLFCQLFKL